jgi:hypothetical protein
MTESTVPVFIHSLFRAGSTYLFDVFRNSSSGCYCYKEPDNEILLRPLENMDPLTESAGANAILRHPRLDRPYLAEFMPLRDAVAHSFRKQFPYDSYFLSANDTEPELAEYLALLISEAHGRPVLQFCRSTGRLAWLRRKFAAHHLFLWRHPWDQWWSYKIAPYFDTANLLILNANAVPPVFQEIRSLLAFRPYHDASLENEFAYFGSHGLAPEHSYLLFFSLWYHAMYEGLRIADVVIGIDALSCSDEYRQETLAQLEVLGVKGVDFSNCHIHQGHFLNCDRAFFESIEHQVRPLFEKHGYTGTIAARIDEMRATIPRPLQLPLEQDLTRLREIYMQQASDSSQLKQLIWSQRLEIERLTRLEAELLSIYNSRPWKALRPLLDTYWTARAHYRNISGGKKNVS